MADPDRRQNTVLLRLLNAFNPDKAEGKIAGDATQSIPVRQVCVSCDALIQSVVMCPAPPGIGALDPLIVSHMPDSDTTPLLSCEARVTVDPLLSSLVEPKTVSYSLAVNTPKKPAAVKPEQFKSPAVSRVSTAPPRLDQQTSHNLVTKSAEPKTLAHLVPQSIAARVHMTRRKAAGLNLSAFAREMKSLAGASGVPEADIQWIGLFHSVPLAAVASMEIDVEGHLSLCLKPEGVKMPTRHAMPMIDLAVGRNRSNGVIIKAVMSPT